MKGKPAELEVPSDSPIKGHPWGTAQVTGIVHLRRGLHPLLRYHPHALRAPLLIDARDD